MGVIQWVGPCTTAWERELRRRGAQGIKLCGVWPMGLLHLRGNDAKKKQGIKKNGKEWCELSSFTVLVERTTMRSRICMGVHFHFSFPAALTVQQVMFVHGQFCGQTFAQNALKSKIMARNDAEGNFNSLMGVRNHCTLCIPFIGRCIANG